MGQWANGPACCRHFIFHVAKSLAHLLIAGIAKLLPISRLLRWVVAWLPEALKPKPTHYGLVAEASSQQLLERRAAPVCRGWRECEDV